VIQSCAALGEFVWFRAHVMPRDIARTRHVYCQISYHVRHFLECCCIAYVFALRMLTVTDPYGRSSALRKCTCRLAAEVSWTGQGRHKWDASLHLRRLQKASSLAPLQVAVSGVWSWPSSVYLVLCPPQLATLRANSRIPRTSPSAADARATQKLYRCGFLPALHVAVLPPCQSSCLAAGVVPIHAGCVLVLCKVSCNLLAACMQRSAPLDLVTGWAFVAA
jgi:hypothetical protein